MSATRLLRAQGGFRKSYRATTPHFPRREGVCNWLPTGFESGPVGRGKMEGATWTVDSPRAGCQTLLVSVRKQVVKRRRQRAWSEEAGFRDGPTERSGQCIERQQGRVKMRRRITRSWRRAASYKQLVTMEEAEAAGRIWNASWVRASRKRAREKVQRGRRELRNRKPDASGGPSRFASDWMFWGLLEDR